MGKIYFFYCYTGLAHIDIKELDLSNIRTVFDDQLWIMGKREKTGVNYNVLLLDVPKQIVDMYSEILSDNKVFPVMSNQKMNEYLKEIGSFCGIDPDLI